MIKYQKLDQDIKDPALDFVDDWKKGWNVDLSKDTYRHKRMAEKIQVLLEIIMHRSLNKEWLRNMKKLLVKVYEQMTELKF